MYRAIALAVLVATPALAPSASAQSPFDSITDTGDRAVLPEAAEIFGSRKPNIEAFDALLKKLPRPTRLRAMVQTARASLLSYADRNTEAVEAIEEAMRILPDDPMPKLMAANVLTFAGAPQRAADLWIAASILSPELARTSEDSVLDTLADRLRVVGDYARADRVLARMGEIGLVAGKANVRSSAALARVRAEVEAGKIEEARRLVSGIVSPTQLLGLYVDRRYEPLWPTIDGWAGKAFVQQERFYLEQLRSEWQAAHEFSAGASYAGGLRRVGAYQAVIDIFLDRLSPGKLTAETEGMDVLAISVAGALVAVGRGEEAVPMLSRLKTLTSEKDGIQSLNLTNGIITTQLSLDKWDQAAETARAWLARAKAIGPEVNGDAILHIARLRACALTAAGRANEAAPEISEILLARGAQPRIALLLYACQNDLPGARKLILDHLEGEKTRSWALTALQPETERGTTSFQKKMDAFGRLLRNDAEVRAAAAKVGRILAEPIDKGLPAGFVPDDPAQRAPQSPDNV